jgi:hypothetical protein
MAKRPLTSSDLPSWIVTFQPDGCAAESFWIEAPEENEARARACRAAGNRSEDNTGVEKVSATLR